MPFRYVILLSLYCEGMTCSSTLFQFSINNYNMKLKNLKRFSVISKPISSQSLKAILQTSGMQWKIKLEKEVELCPYKALLLISCTVYQWPHTPNFSLASSTANSFYASLTILSVEIPKPSS